MDFLDPKKQKAHSIRLMVGYVLIGLAVLLSTTILLYLSYGFDLGKNGQVIQNGLVFISSQPNPANILVEGIPNGTTNKRIFLEAGQYTFKLTRSGYRPWVRDITVQGGSVEHFDYPVLFPITFHPSDIKSYSTLPGILLESPSRQWLLIQSPSNFNQFDQFNLNQSTPSLVESNQNTITLPSNVLTASTGPQSWQLVQWSTDNQHILMKHLFEVDGQSANEYILVNRQNPSQSINLTNTLGTNPTELRMINNDYTKYYIFNQSAGTIDTASLSSPAPQPFLKNIIAFNQYGSNMLLYATGQNAQNGKAWINLMQGTTLYPIREVNDPANSQFLLDFTQYNGDWYVAAGNASENKIYIYQNPQVQVQADPNEAVTPIEIMKINNPDQLAFSANAQFIMSESSNSTNFSVYDAQNNKYYAYQVHYPIDASQQYATWMDGDRIMYYSGGKLVVFDYDSANQQLLMPGLPSYPAAFDSNYRYVYTMINQPANGSTPAQTELQATPLVTSADL